MIRTNVDDLVMVAVSGEVSAPGLLRSPYRPSVDGVSTILIGMAGVVYNARVGDPAFGWEGDHVEPGVSLSHPDTDVDYAMHYLTCVGNEAVVVDGLAAGARGIVTGEHARLLIDFVPEVLEQLCVGDKVIIKTFGRGMRLRSTLQVSFIAGMDSQQLFEQPSRFVGLADLEAEMGEPRGRYLGVLGGGQFFRIGAPGIHQSTIDGLSLTIQRLLLTGLSRLELSLQRLGHDDQGGFFVG